MNVENLQPHIEALDEAMKNDKRIDSYSLYVVVNSGNKIALCTSGLGTFSDECSHVKQIELHLIKKAANESQGKQIY